ERRGSLSRRQVSDSSELYAALPINLRRRRALRDEDCAGGGERLGRYAEALRLREMLCHGREGPGAVTLAPGDATRAIERPPCEGRGVRRGALCDLERCEDPSPGVAGRVFQRAEGLSAQRVPQFDGEMRSDRGEGSGAGGWLRDASGERDHLVVEIGRVGR